MLASKEYSNLIDQIRAYRKKFYLNQLLKGALIGGGLIFAIFIIINFLEYFGRFNTGIRAALFFTFLAASAYTLFFLILKPLFYLYNINKPLSDSQAAQQIGNFFPNIKDKLLNTLQLASQNKSEENNLLTASILQKSKELTLVRFVDAINFKDNRRFLKYLAIPLLAIVFISAVKPTFFKSTERIVNFNKTFKDPAPFQFEILNKNLKAIKNEDYELKLKLLGNTLPEDVFIVAQDRKFKMNINDPRSFNFIFSNVQKDTDFHFEAGGYTSDSYNLKLIAKPSLLSFNVELDYPAYLNKPTEEFDNMGNLVVPEGTNIHWKFKTDNTDSLKMVFDGKQAFNLTTGPITDFNLKKKQTVSAPYEIELKNNTAPDPEKINYYINVIPDKYPAISLEQLKDTTLYNYIGIGGSITDDYGISDFKFFYRNKSDKNQAYKTAPVPFNRSSISQTFFYQVNINSLGLNKGDQLEYYLQVTDNDGVNGKKSSKTTLMTFGMPTASEFDKEVDKQIEKSEEKFDDLLQKSKEFKKALESLDTELKKKKELDFQDKKELEDLLKKKEELNKAIKDLQQKLQDIKEKQNRFDQQSPELQKKMDMLQKLLDDIMKNADDKTLEKMKEELEKNLDEKSLNKLDDFKKDQRNLDKNIDRALKQFQKLQLKQKIESTAKELEKLADKQEQLAEKTEKEPNVVKNEELKKEQEKLNKEFEEKKEKLNDIEKQSKELKKEFDKQEEKQEEVQKEQKEAQKEMKKDDAKAASKAQKKASKSMRNMAAAMMEGEMEGEMKELDMDMDALRDILENLIKISIDQEDVLKSFKNISVSDARFIPLSQQQLKISDDAKIVEDSLYVLAKRVLQIEAFVTDEVTKMKNNIDDALRLIKERKTPQAAAKQQFSMTSMNNLALMLSDTFKQMQQQMAAAMPGGGKGGKDGKAPAEGMGKQQQDINKKIQGLGQSGQGGQQMSESLAKIANEQAKLRRQIKELQEQLNGTEQGKKIGNNLSEIQKKMDESENDLVNKRITPNLAKRQLEIETRLLEAEKAIKEQELDPKRKANTGVTFNRTSPPDLEKFKKEREKQVELLRTTPPNFTPFYKKQTESYFKNIK
jgi:hypothetical protein